MYEDEVKVEETEAEPVAPVEYTDETLVCVECGKEFVFTAGEQEFYASKGYTNKPKRCKACRDAKKNGGDSNGTRQYYYAVCSECGGEAKLTFQPSLDKPVYCSACFDKRRRAAR
jgi:CxxC-x17-CxxC domain-containing protein